jgi:hypothetical protein
MRVIVFDTETVNIKELSAFDLGYVVTDNGMPIEQASFLIEETYKSPLFKEAYYYEKNKERYEEYERTGESVVVALAQAREDLNKAIVNHKVEVIAGFIISFDIRVLNYNFKKYLGETREISTETLGKTRLVIDIPVLFALLYNGKEYKDWCKRTGNLTDKGNYKTTAETIYRFISGNDSHEEEHTALQDSIEESTIFWHLVTKFNLTKEHAIMQEASQLTKKSKAAWQILKD